MFVVDYKRKQAVQNALRAGQLPPEKKKQSIPPQMRSRALREAAATPQEAIEMAATAMAATATAATATAATATAATATTATATTVTATAATATTIQKVITLFKKIFLPFSETHFYWFNNS